uniref:Secreted protein n=1 Tax=Globodera rostochiensis TaxID=31243 RepID=A0A914H377_GLORO
MTLHNHLGICYEQNAFATRSGTELAGTELAQDGVGSGRSWRDGVGWDGVGGTELAGTELVDGVGPFRFS